MAVRRWDPFTILARLDDDFDELVRRTWGTTSPGGRTTTGYVPAIDMTSRGRDVMITLELPGVDIEKDVDIEVADGRLVISGERGESHTEGGEGTKPLVREMRYGSFRREFALPDGVTADDVEATYDNGLLHVKVANVTRAIPEPRKIAVKSAERGGHKMVEGKVESST